MNQTQVKSLSQVCSLLLIIGFILTLPGKGQSIKFSNSIVDFGQIAANAFPPRVIEFTNTSDQKLAILIIDKSTDAKVEFIPGFYDPGEKGSIAVQYQPRNEGEFEEVIRIYTNLDEPPAKLTLKGTAISLLECFPDPRNLLKRTVVVIDSETKLPVANTEVSMVHNLKYDKPLKFSVDRKGESLEVLPIGMYHIEAHAVGYENFTEDRFIPRSMPAVILNINPIQKTPVPQEPPQILPRTNTEFEEEPVMVEPEINVTSTDLPENLYAANNLIFLLDVSTSMKLGEKFILLQQSVNNLALILRSIDNVSVITYSHNAKIQLKDVKGSNRRRIIRTVQGLECYGTTNGVKGLNKAYEIAEAGYIKDGNNQIILMTDGEFSQKGISDRQHLDLLSDYASRGIKLSIIGFGINQEAIDSMKRLSSAGGGSFILVESGSYVKEVLVDEVKSKSFMGE